MLEALCVMTEIDGVAQPQVGLAHTRPPIHMPMEERASTTSLSVSSLDITRARRDQITGLTVDLSPHGDGYISWVRFGCLLLA